MTAVLHSRKPLLISKPVYSSFHLTPAREELTHLAEVLPHDLNEVWHRKVHDVVSPGGLQHHVRSQQVVAGEQAGGKTLLLVLL